MCEPLLANRYARDSAGRTIDLATGASVLISGAHGSRETRPTDHVLSDEGSDDRGNPFRVWTPIERRDAVTPDTIAAPHPELVRNAADALDLHRTEDVTEIVVPEAEPGASATVLAIAREARTRGYVPVCLAGLQRLPAPALIASRAVVVLDPRQRNRNPGGAAAVAGDDKAQPLAAALVSSALRARISLIVTAGRLEQSRYRPATGALRSATQVAEAAPAWSAAAPAGARTEHRLLSERGQFRRRGDVPGYLRASVRLARARLERLAFSSAVRMTRESRTWSRWWHQAPVSRDVLTLVTSLLAIEQHALIEQGASRDDRAGPQLAVWAARCLALSDVEADARTTLALSWRIEGQPETALHVLGDRWPHDSSTVVQRRWAHEVIWAACLSGRWARAISTVDWLRGCDASESAADSPEAALDLATLQHLVGDRRGRDRALASCTAARAALLPLDRARLDVLRAAARGHTGRDRRQCRSAPRARRTIVPASLRAEQRHLMRHRDAAVRTDASPTPRAADPHERGGAMDEVLELLHVCQHGEDDDPLRRACGVLRDRLRAVAVGVWGAASAEPLGGSGTGRSWPAAIAERARVTGLPHGPEPNGAAIDAAWPIRDGSTTIGAVACRWLPQTQPDATRVKILLTAAAAVCAPAVRERAERATAPVPADAMGLVGESVAMHDLRRGIVRAAGAPYHVLVEGESGSGKELVARAVHHASARRQKRFCAINCAALTDDLLEAELFGHSRGAFTGALAERAGLFEDASGGTLFLDEVADLSPRGQAKVLRVLQDGEVRRLGENFARRVEVRVVAASNQPLREAVARGRFREDLRYRLDVLRLAVPPLRERRDDVPLLAGHFWREAVQRVGSRATLDPGVVAALSRYDWPGNVRELQNVIASLAVHAPARGRVGPSALPEAIRGTGCPIAGALSLHEARRRFEVEYVRLALARSGGRRHEAARSLGLSRQGLAKLMTRLGLEGARA